MENYGINAGKLVLVTLLSIILTVVAIVGLQALYYRCEAGRLPGLDAEVLSPKTAAEIQRQQETLTDYMLVDREKGTVFLSINRAMELVVEEISTGKPAREVPDES